MKEYDESTQFGRLQIVANDKHREIRTSADLARHLNIAPQILTNWKKRGLPAKMIYSLADEFDCNYKWLITGEGRMHSTPISFTSQDEMLKKDIIAMINHMSGRELLQAKSLFEIINFPEESEEEKRVGKARKQQ